MRRLHARQTTSPGTTIPECGTIEFPIPTSPPTTPPYTLIVYATDSDIPSAYSLNLTDQRALWTVVYSGPVVLTAYIVNSRGTSVGTPARYTVQSTNDSRACLPPSRPRVQSPITAVINLPTTDPSPQMCTPLLINVNGGQKPYNVTVVPVGVAPASNITMGPNDNAVYLVNPFPPSTRFSVAVSDSQGASKVIQSYTVDNTTEGSNSTTGGTDTNCPGQGTYSFNSNDPTGNNSNSSLTTTASNDSGNNNSGNGTNGNNQNGGLRTAAFAGGVGGAILLLVLFLGFILFRRRNGSGDKRRGRYHQARATDSPDPVLIDSLAAGGSMHQTSAPSTPFVHPYYGRPPSEIGVPAESTPSASQKAVETEQNSRALPSHSVNSDPQVIQHTDAGVVPELPPAYGDASTH